ncbi:ATP-binding protein [uncultured Megasphaera sp.]
MFANETLVTARIDRLAHHSHVLNMNSASFRFDATI